MDPFITSNKVLCSAVRVFVKGLRILERVHRNGISLGVAVPTGCGCNATNHQLHQQWITEQRKWQWRCSVPFSSAHTSTGVSLIFMGKLILIRLLLFHTAASVVRAKSRSAGLSCCCDCWRLKRHKMSGRGYVTLPTQSARSGTNRPSSWRREEEEEV